MGVILARYFAVAKKKGGLPLQIKLAMRTGISEPRALEMPDSSENLARFDAALDELVGYDFASHGHASSSKSR